MGIITDQEAIGNFVRTQKLLGAVNVISIHTKLRLAGESDPERIEGAQEARRTLTTFLEELEGLVRRAEEGKPLLGVSPRQGQFARRFLEAQHDKREVVSELASTPFSKTIELVNSTEVEDKKETVVRLEGLRILLEEQHQGLFTEI